MGIKIKILAIILVLTAGIVFACGDADKENKDLQTEGTVPAKDLRQLPSFVMIDAEGNKINLNSFKGKKVFVNHWASWCPPCREEMPSIEALAAKADKNKVAFVMLSLDNKFDAARKFAEANELKLPIYYPGENLPAVFNTQVIPATFIFDERGMLVKQINGSDDYDTRAYLDLLINAGK
jgi:thiol-disulfide isomerase/thioredoxin